MIVLLCGSEDRSVKSRAGGEIMKIPLGRR